MRLPQSYAFRDLSYNFKAEELLLSKSKYAKEMVPY